MEVKSVNSLETNKSEVTVFISPEEFEQALQAAFQRQKGRYQLPGFRKGKAPRKMLEKYYGESLFFEDAVNDKYRDAVNLAVEESKLDVVAVGKVDVADIGKEQGVTLTVEVITKPEVTVEDYAGIEIHKEPVVVSEGDIDREIEQVRERNSRTVTVEDRAAKDGDITEIDFEGFVDGVAFDGGKGENFQLTLGSGQFIPGFEEKIIGHKTGEEFEIDVTFPEDYSAEELKGKAAVFKIKLHEIKEKQLPEVDDEFVKDVSEFDTLAEYREDLKKSLLKRREDAADRDVDNQLAEALIGKVQVELPQEMVDNEIDESINSFAYQLQSQGLKLETYLQYTGMTTDDLRQQYSERSVQQLKLRLGLEKISQLEGIEPTEEELEAEYKTLADQYGMPVENIRNVVRENDLKQDVRNRKAMDLVREKANVIEAVKDGEEEKKPAKKAPAKKAAAKKEEASDEDKPAPKKRVSRKKEEQPAE